MNVVRKTPDINSKRCDINLNLTGKFGQKTKGLGMSKASVEDQINHSQEEMQVYLNQNQPLKYSQKK